MPMYLESQDGTQSYRADLFCPEWKELKEGELYNPADIGFIDWLRTAGNQHKPPQKKLKAVWYGPKQQEDGGEDE